MKLLRSLLLVVGLSVAMLLVQDIAATRADHMDHKMDEAIKLCAMHTNNPAFAENCAEVRDMQRQRDEVRKTLKDPRHDHQRALDYFQIQKFLDGKG